MAISLGNIVRSENGWEDLEPVLKFSEFTDLIQ